METNFDKIRQLEEQYDEKLFELELLNEDSNIITLLLQFSGIALGIGGVVLGLPKIIGWLNQYLDIGFDTIKDLVMDKKLKNNEYEIANISRNLSANKNINELMSALERNSKISSDMKQFVRADKPTRIKIAHKMRDYIDNTTGLDKGFTNQILSDLVDLYLKKNKG